MWIAQHDFNDVVESIRSHLHVSTEFHKKKKCLLVNVTPSESSANSPLNVDGIAKIDIFLIPINITILHIHSWKIAKRSLIFVLLILLLLLLLLLVYMVYKPNYLIQ